MALFKHLKLGNETNLRRDSNREIKRALQMKAKRRL
jgi:hypothetical protein